MSCGNMSRYLRHQSLVHARRAGFARKIQQAQAVIAQAMHQPGPWCVSFSGGKDSTVLLDLVLEQDPEVDICWFDDGWDYPETHQFLAATAERVGRPLHQIPYPLSASFWREELPYTGDDPAYAHTGTLAYTAWQQQYRGCFLGLRAEESVTRRMTLRQRGPLYFSAAANHGHCCPLAWWSTQDVWAYLVSRDLPYNAVYDTLETLGIPLAQRRVGPVTAWMVWQYGLLAVLKRGWPELYHRFIQHFPQASTYA